MRAGRHIRGHRHEGAAQIAAARQIAAELAIPNVQFHRWSVGDSGADLGQFDYIIAHDVYAPSEDAERERISVAMPRGTSLRKAWRWSTIRPIPGRTRATC